MEDDLASFKGTFTIDDDTLAPPGLDAYSAQMDPL